MERPASAAGNYYYHGAKYEPVTGTYLGMFAEGDAQMHDWNSPSADYWYFGGTPRLTGKEHAVYMLYVHYEDDGSIPNYTSHFAEAKRRGKAIQLSLEPGSGLDNVQDNEHLRKLAQQCADTGVPIFLRFAGEFNDSGNAWYKDGSAKFIEKFRLVANVFHTLAPNVAMVWAPNDWPIGSEHAYYPGDEYVDWVGVSAYPVYNANGSPKQGNTWVDRFRLLYDTYSPRKPIMLTEGAPSATVESHPEQSVLESARYEVLRFYASVARRFPNVKLITYWSENEEWGRLIQCELSSLPEMLSAYKSAIADPWYLGDFNTSSEICYLPVSWGLKAEPEKISCYVNNAKTRVQKAVYYLDGAYAGEGYFPDFTAEIDFSAWSGRSVSLRADFYGEQGQYVARSPVTSVYVAGPTVTPSPQKLNVNGAEESTEIYNIDGNNYFKLRDIAALLDGTSSQFSVDYDDAAKQIVVYTGGSYTLQEGDLSLPGADAMQTKARNARKSSQSLKIDGRTVSGMNVFNIGGNNYFKLRDINEVLRFNVGYDETSGTILITSR